MKKILLILIIMALGSPFILSLDNADVVGIWNCKTDTEQSLDFKLTLFEKNGRLFGKYNTENQEMILHYIRILNDELRFQTEARGLKIKYRATVEDNKINGSISTKDLVVEFSGTKLQPEDKNSPSAPAIPMGGGNIPKSGE